jgi:hypothetical protein
MALSSVNRTKQAGDIIIEVGVEVGLPRVTDPFVSNDPQYQRMISMLNIAGNALIEFHPWTRLQVNGTIVTIPGESIYPLPDDFSSITDSTVWKKGTLQPGVGSVSPQWWAYFTNVPLVGTISVVYRERRGSFEVIPTPDSEFFITYEYISRAWVLTGSATRRDNVTQYSDVVLHDPLLISRYLKLRFLEALGFDSQTAKDEFNFVLESISSKDKSAPILTSAVSTGIGRLIDINNLPETGYGS